MQTFGIEPGMTGGRLHFQFAGQSSSASHLISQVDVSPPGPAAVTQSWPSAHPDAGQVCPMPAVDVSGRSPQPVIVIEKRTTNALAASRIISELLLHSR